MDYVAIFSLIRDFFDQILVLFFIFNIHTFHGPHYINIFVFLFINFFHSHEMNSRGSHELVVWFAFSSAFSFLLGLLLLHYQEWTSFKDLRRRCVVNILTLNTVNQQSYNECQLYYFYSRKIKTFFYIKIKMCTYIGFTFTVNSSKYGKFVNIQIECWTSGTGDICSIHVLRYAFFNFALAYTDLLLFYFFFAFWERRSSWYTFEEK